MSRFATPLLCAVVVLLGCVHVLLLPRDEQARLSYDALRYLAGAESLLAEGKYLDVDGRPQQVWPVGTSLLYAALAKVSGAAPMSLVGFVDIVAYLITALACIVIAWATRMRAPIAVMFVAAVVCNGVVLSMHNKLWSDPLALALLAALFAALITERWPLAWVFAALAILLRYAMLATIPLLILAALFARRKRVALLTPLAVLPAIVAMFATGAARGNRSMSVRSLPWNENFEAVLRMADQVFPSRIGVLAIVLFFAFCVFAPLAIAGATGSQPVESSGRRAESPSLHAALLGSLWALGYAVFLPIAQAFAYPSFALDVRILTPLLLGALLATAAACELLARRRIAFAAILAIPLLLASIRSIRYAITQLGPQPAEAQQCIDRTSYVAMIRAAAPADGPLASNAQGTVWFALRRPVGPPEVKGALVWINPKYACPGTIELDMKPPRGAFANDTFSVIPWSGR